MNDLVFLKKDDAFTNSMLIADGTEIEHQKIKDAIRKPRNQMEMFGRLSAQCKAESTGGRPEGAVRDHSRVGLSGGKSMKYENVAARITLAMEKKTITSAELARQSGVNTVSISQYRHGAHSPSYNSAKEIGNVLCVNPLWLMGFDVPMN